MSRSYRRPYYTDGYKGSRTKQFLKSYFNRVLRRFDAFDETLVNGGMYKKVNESWDICDYCFRYNFKPTYYWWRGEMKLLEKSPLWQVNRK